MWNWLNETIMTFRKCFRREATFRWFAIAVLGFMTWQEHKGVTSFVRELYIAPQYYETFLHFFRSNAWQLNELRSHWIRIVKNTDVLFQESNMAILIGDGVKQGKEAKKMPYVKKLYQESESSSKVAYIFGHILALEAIKELKLTNQIASENNINPNLLTRWKSEAIKNLPSFLQKKQVKLIN